MQFSKSWHNNVSVISGGMISKKEKLLNDHQTTKN